MDTTTEHLDDHSSPDDGLNPAWKAPTGTIGVTRPRCWSRSLILAVLVPFITFETRRIDVDATRRHDRGNKRTLTRSVKLT